MDVSNEGHPAGFSAEALRWRELADGIRAMDPDAAQEWVDRQWRAVWLLLRRKLGASATPDLARAALTEAIPEVRAGRIDDPSGLTVWLRGFAARFATETPLRRIEKEAARAGLPVAGLVATLRSASAKEREALARFYIEGHAQEEISRELAIPIEEFEHLRARLRLAGSRRAAGAETDRGARAGAA